MKVSLALRCAAAVRSGKSQRAEIKRQLDVWRESVRGRVCPRVYTCVRLRVFGVRIDE